MNNVVLPMLVMILLYFTFASSAQVTELPIVGEQFMPQALINSLIALTVIILAVSVLGFLGAASETKFALEAYISVLAICALGVLI
jgi:hypothetical protein